VKHYSDKDFVALLEAVEAQGGDYAAETCKPRHIKELNLKQAPPAFDTGCGEDALFHVPYDPYANVIVNEPKLIPDPSNKDRKVQARDDDDNLLYTPVSRMVNHPARGELRSVRVCANDDLMRHWPRFQEVMEDPDPSTGVK
jgi:hypothetical protein